MVTKNKAKRISQGDNLRTFGDVCSFVVGESALEPGKVQITQYGSCLIGTLTPAQARDLAEFLISAATALEGGS